MEDAAGDLCHMVLGPAGTSPLQSGTIIVPVLQVWKLRLRGHRCVLEVTTALIRKDEKAQPDQSQQNSHP